MIFEFFLNIFVNLIINAISVFNVISIPIDFVKTLSAVTGYGSYVVGSDLMLIIFSVISFWLSVKVGLGLFLFVWRLLPFT